MIAFAPGKLVLMGEYAVLDGGPALVLAVDRGVCCEVTTGGEGVRIESDEDDRFVRAALVDVGAPPGRYRFFADPPVRTPKLGLGTSAAATVAAALAGSPDMAPQERYERCREVHRAVQGGGSGLDVAASVFGGGLCFATGTVHEVSLPMPVVVYSGAPARTGPRTDAYLRWAARAAFVRESERLVGRFGSDPIGAVRAARQLLQAMAESAHIAYRTGALDRIAEAAEALGGAAKPSGAGGGDCAVAFFPEAGPESAFRAAMTELGFPVLDVHPSRGAHVR